MLRTIEDPYSPSFADTGEGGGGQTLSRSPLIKRPESDHARIAADLLSQAETRAAAVIASAEQEAVAIRANGFREGVAEGMAAALAPMAAMVSQWEAVHRTMRDKIVSALADCVEDLFKNDQVLSALLSVILSERLPHESGNVRVFAPSADVIPELRSRCEALGISASVERGRDPGTFSVEWGGHVWKAHFADVKALVLSQALQDIAVPEVSDAREACRTALIEAAERLFQKR